MLLPRNNMASFALWLAVFLVGVNGFYLPGIAPKSYKQDDPLPVFVNALESIKTTLPYGFYYPQFHFCKPEGGPKPQGESLGSVLMGDRLYSSAFDIKFNQSVDCAELCSEADIPANDAKFINKRIAEDYQLYLEIDGLPAGEQVEDTMSKEVFYRAGFPLGYNENEDNQYLFNHYEFIIQYNKDIASGNFRVVGILVKPSSIGERDSGNRCKPTSMLKLSSDSSNKVMYTYSVSFQPSSDEWRTRWDKYLHVYDPKIHWFNIINSIVIVFFLTGMVAMILFRALHKDIKRYNEIDQEDAQEDFGWKLVHGDVFRSPSRFWLLSVLLGSGAQLFLMGCVTLIFAALGFLSPSNRGSLVTTMIVTYVLSAAWGGYISARFYKMFGGESWKSNVLSTAFLVPGCVFATFIILNFFLISAKSSSAVPFGTMFALVVLWFLISVPLCFVGAYIGFKKPKIEHPTRTKQIPRQIPEQALYLKSIPSILMGGILPFGAIFIELYFIMNSLWAHQVYYMFGFLFVVGIVLILTCAEVTILMCYFHLVAEDYHWWWRSFLTSGACAIYVFLYSILYFRSIGGSSNVNSAALYFGWSLVMSSLMFISTGFIGFYSCYLFVRKIYSSIKID